MKLKLWSWILSVSNYKSGKLMPFSLRVIRSILFPFQTAYYAIGHSQGYNIMTNTWLIHGKYYSDDLFAQFTIPDEKRLFRIVQSDDPKLVTLETIIPVE